MSPAARQILIAKMTTTGLLLRFQETATRAYGLLRQRSDTSTPASAD